MTLISEILASSAEPKLNELSKLAQLFALSHCKTDLEMPYSVVSEHRQIENMVRVE